MVRVGPATRSAAATCYIKVLSDQAQNTYHALQLGSAQRCLLLLEELGIDVKESSKGWGCGHRS